MSEKVPGFEKLELSEVMNSLNAEYTSLDGGYQNGATKRERDYKMYAMKPYGDEIVGRSKTVDSTIFDKIEWLTPNIVRPFVEGDDVIAVEPEDEDSVVASAYMKEILNYQLKRSQSWYDIVHACVKSALIYGNSYAKLHFEKRDGGLPDIVSIEPVHPAEIRFDWDTDDFYSSSVVIHDASLTASDLKKMKGKPGYINSGIDELLGMEGNEYKYMTERGSEQRERVNSRMYLGTGAVQFNDENKYFVVHEHYCNMDVDDSGKSIPVVAMHCRGQLIYFQKNPFPDKKPPFVVFQAVREPFTGVGWSMSDILGDVQRTRTAIKRDIEDNLASQANGMWGADLTKVSNTGIRLLRNGVAGSVVPTDGAPNAAIQSLSPTPMAPHAFQYLNQLSAEADMKSGYTKSATMDSKMLGAKATSAEIVFNSGQMRIWEMAQRMLETGFKVMLRKAIAYNQKWLSASQLKAMFGDQAGEWMKFSKEDIGGKLNATLNISLASDKQEQISMYSQMYQMAIQNSATDPNASKMAEFAWVKMFELMGIKEARYFLEDRNAVGGTGGVALPGGMEEEAGAAGIGADVLGAGSLEGITEIAGLGGVDAASEGLALEEAGLGAEAFGGTV
jgi:hypothetical protein